MHMQTVQYPDPKNPVFRDLEIDPTKIIGVEALDESPEKPMTRVIFDNGMTANVHMAADALWQQIYDAKVAMMAAALKASFGDSAGNLQLAPSIKAAPSPEQDL